MHIGNLIDDSKVTSDPVELDPSQWSEVVGGSPKGTWGALLDVQRLAAELLPTAS